MAQKRIMQLARQIHPDAANSFDPNREQRDRKEEESWRLDAERRFGTQHPPQHPSRSFGRNGDGGYYGSRQRAQSGHVPLTRYEYYDRTATQRLQRAADEDGGQLPVPPPRPDLRTTTPFKDMFVTPYDTEKYKAKMNWSPQPTEAEVTLYRTYDRPMNPLTAIFRNIQRLARKGHPPEPCRPVRPARLRHVTRHQHLH